MKGSKLIRKLIALSLEEDLAFGDITASLTVPENHQSTARIIARQPLVMCGVEVIQMVIQEGHWNITCEWKVGDGDLVKEEGVLAEVAGPTRDLLAAERTVLNFLQRMSGVATFTREYSQVELSLIILDTRKTIPGWRMLDKYAVRVGGGKNHRLCLGDMILVKNNHIDAHPQGMRGALAHIADNKPLYMPWEVEVRNLDELAIALEFKPTIIMLDNFSDQHIREAVGIIRAQGEAPLIEVSGGVTKERLHAIREAGADAASVGALTTQAPSVDISMRIVAAAHA